MTDREKLKNMIRDGHDYFYNEDYKGLDVYDAIAEYLLAHGVTFATDTNDGSKWISVSERLPKNRNEVVIIALRWGEVDVGWCEDGVWGSEFVNEYEDGEVTHWMPLPSTEGLHEP